MNTKIKNIGIVVIIIGIAFLIYHYSSNKEQEELVENKKVLEILPENDNQIKLVEDLKKYDLNILENNVVSYTVPSVEDFDKWEWISKKKDGTVILEFLNENDNIQNISLKQLDLNLEHIFYVLQKYTNYSIKNNSLKNLSYSFNYDEADFDEDSFVKVLLDDKFIYVIMAKEKEALDLVLEKKIIKKESKSDLFTYLEENNEILNKVETAYKKQNNEIKKADAKIPQGIKEFGLSFYDAFSTLDKNLINYYDKEIWFYHDPEEWFGDKGNNDKVLSKLKTSKIIDNYPEDEKEELIDDAGLFKKLKKTFKFYYPEDMLKICHKENKEEFLKYLHVEDGDVIMFSKTGIFNLNPCTLDGRFNFNDKFFWIIRKIDDVNKIVVEFS